MNFVRTCECVASSNKVSLVTCVFDFSWKTVTVLKPKLMSYRRLTLEVNNHRTCFMDCYSNETCSLLFIFGIFACELKVICCRRGRVCEWRAKMRSRTKLQERGGRVPVRLSSGIRLHPRIRTRSLRRHRRVSPEPAG